MIPPRHRQVAGLFYGALSRPEVDSMTEFNQAYYRRYYRDPVTRVAGAEEADKSAALALAFAGRHGLTIRRVVDLGCGLGHWRKALEARVKRLRYDGVEWSEYLCRRYGWIHSSAAEYRSDKSYDLAVCQSVLQYLDDKAATKAMANLGRLTHGLLYFEVLTLEDWRFRVDRKKTDGAVHLRPTAWYRQKLSSRFIPLGGGFFAHKRARLTLYTLEEMA